MAKKKVVKRKPYRAKRYGILNHLGDIWTPETFISKPVAEQYLTLQGRANPSWKLGQHKVVPVRVTISLAPQ